MSSLFFVCLYVYVCICGILLRPLGVSKLDYTIPSKSAITIDLETVKHLHKLNNVKIPRNE